MVIPVAAYLVALGKRHFDQFRMRFCNCASVIKCGFDLMFVQDIEDSRHPRGNQLVRNVIVQSVFCQGLLFNVNSE